MAIQIVDDEPTAVDDSNQIDLSAGSDQIQLFALQDPAVSISGNVMDNDLAGADGATVTTQDLSDDIGHFVLAADGSYTFELNDNNAQIQALDSGETLVREYTYVLTDGDGDSSEATLTITITGSNDGPSLEVLGEGGQVFESGLASGSDAASDSELTSGSFRVGDADGLDDIQSITIAGTELPVGPDGLLGLVGETVNTPYGQVTLDSFDETSGTFTYIYELLRPVDNDSSAAVSAGADTNGFSETISLEVFDGDDRASGSFDVYIADDQPASGLNDTVQLDDDALANGIVGGTDDDVDANHLTGTLSHTFGADGGTLSWSTETPTSGFTYVLDADDSNILYIMQGDTKVMTLTLDPDTGDYSVEQNAPVTHADGLDENNATIDVGYVVTDGDADVKPGTLTIKVDDDTPVAQDDYATVEAGSQQNFNVCFVLDFSGSISNTNVDTMLDAVQAAATKLFNEASGNVAIQLVAFSGTAQAYDVVTTLSDLTDLLNSLNPTLPGGDRPYDGWTDFTAAVNEVMDSFTPVVGSSNQVFFISDGNPNEQTGTNNALSDSVAPIWNEYVDNHNLNVTTIGVGSNINTGNLQDVDVDGLGTPILISGFDALVSTLVDQVAGGLVSGNVLSGSDNSVGTADDDGFGADGAGHISAIVINGVTYSWDGNETITVTTATGETTVTGHSLTGVATEYGGALSFDFSNGSWSYQAADDINGDRQESFEYTIVDSDGDPSSATLHVYVEDPSPLVAQVDEDELSGGKTDNDAVTTEATGNVGDLVVGSAQGVSFSLKTDTSSLTPATSDGVGLVYQVSGNTLTATAGNTPIFTLVVETDGDYTFTLNGPIDHLLGNGDDDELLSLNFASLLLAEDTDGNPVTLSGDFIIQIEDDVPVAVADEDAIAEDGVSNQIHGNVLLNDAQGADGAEVIPKTQTNALGTFTLLANGEYTFTLNNANPAVQRLDDGETLTQSFSYTLKDADGDTSTASVTITINGSDDPLVANDDAASVSEAAVQSAVIDSASVTGTKNVLTNDTDPDTSDKPLAVSDTSPQGLFLLNSDGSLSTTQVGTITFTSTGGYSFSLFDNYKAMANALDANETMKVGAEYTAVNTDSATDEALLRITINGADDAMTAVDDVDSLTEDQVQTTVSGNINVLTNDVEPDATDNPLVVSDTVSQKLYLLNADGSLSTTHAGYITFNSTGGYSLTLLDSYKAQANALDSEQSFKVGVEYTARNQDNVSDDAILRITITGADDAMTAVDDSDNFTEGAVQSTVSGHINVLTNDTDPDTSDRPLAVSDTSPQGLFLLNPDGSLSTTQVGTITFTSTGGYSFSLFEHYKAMANALDLGETMKVGAEYTAVNTDSATDEALLRVTITGTNSDPTIVVDTDPLTTGNQSSESVYESGLTGGSSATGNGEFATGQFTVGDADGLDDITSITIGTQVLNVGPLGLAGLVGSAVTTGHGELSITGYSNGTFTYQYQLKSAVDNPSPSSESVTESINLSVSDGSSSAHTSFNVQIVDDTPSAVADTVKSGAVSTETVNLILMLDTSGSIGDANMALIKSAVANLINTYGSALQSVMVVDFDSDATVLTYNNGTKEMTWLSGEEAIARINQADVYSEGYTDYDDALDVVMSTYQNATISQERVTADKTYAYFLSDGEPYGSDGFDTNDIDDDERGAWVDFLNSLKNTAAQIDEVYAIGIGSGVSQTDSDLRDVAWTSDSSGDSNANVILISSASQLSGTLTQLASNSTGNVTTNDVWGADGSDAIKLQSVTFDADGAGAGAVTTYTFDGSHSSYTIDLGATIGSLQINSDGSYVFTPPSSGATGNAVTLGYTIVDGDGDTSSSTLTIQPNHAPVAGDDNIITNILSGTLTLPSSILLANDSDADGDTLTVSKTAFITDWQPRGADFTSSSIVTKTVGNTATLNRSDFSKTGQLANYATLTVKGALNGVNQGNNSDLLTLALVAGEVLSISTVLGGTVDAATDIAFEYRRVGDTEFTPLSGGYLNCDVSGNYQIRVVNVDDNGAATGGGTGGENYTLGLSINYAAAADDAPTVTSSYVVSDSRGGEDEAHVTLSYQSGTTLNGTDGNDTLIANDTSTTLNGGAGNDILIGGAGDDTLNGDAGDDQLSGGAGNDTLRGGLGADILTGGDGADIFKFMTADKDAHVDTIKDFAIGQDKLDLSDVLNDPTTGSLANYLSVVQGSGEDALVKVYSAGNATGGGAPDMTIALEGLGSNAIELQQLQDYLVNHDGVIK
ncbi:VCBS domain-containing protein [Pseudaeromonas sharmana]|uniref:VCBS domain-containing protein n=1 Tax=Pseudaeromonas sharmana TaxID=328412 RepID=A0ABV8CRI1_9GAMM